MVNLGKVVPKVKLQFDSVDDLSDYFDKAHKSLVESHYEQLSDMRRAFVKRLEEIEASREDALNTLLESAITERDAEKALEVFETIE